MELVFLSTLSHSYPSAPPPNFKVFQCSVLAIKRTKVRPARCHTVPSVTANFEMEAVWKARHSPRAPRTCLETQRVSFRSLPQNSHSPSAEAPYPAPPPSSSHNTEKQWHQSVSDCQGHWGLASHSKHVGKFVWKLCRYGCVWPCQLQKQMLISFI